MPVRKIKFATNEIYHIYNRGVEKRIIFEDQQDFQRFIETINAVNTTTRIESIREYRHHKDLVDTGDKLVEFIAIAVPNNHYHFLLREVTENGVSKFMQKFGCAYTNYFNERYGRSGALFQGAFKAKHVDTNEYLLYLSAYINLNDLVHNPRTPTPGIKYVTTWQNYLGCVGIDINISKSIILDQFKSMQEYNDFALSSLVSIKENKYLLRDVKEDDLL